MKVCMLKLLYDDFVVVVGVAKFTIFELVSKMSRMEVIKFGNFSNPRSSPSLPLPGAPPPPRPGAVDYAWVHLPTMEALVEFTRAVDAKRAIQDRATAPWGCSPWVPGHGVHRYWTGEGGTSAGWAPRVGVPFFSHYYQPVPIGLHARSVSSTSSCLFYLDTKHGVFYHVPRLMGTAYPGTTRK